MFSKKMIWLFALCGLAAGQTFAQTNPATPDTSAPRTTQTLAGKIKPKLTHLGLAVAPEYQYLGAAGGYGQGYGASGMLIFNRRWSIGAAAFGTRGFDPKLSDNSGLRMNYHAAGGILEFTPRPDRLVHLSFPLFLGAGMARLDSTGFRGNDHFDGPDGHTGRDFADGGRRGENAFFVAQPNVRVEMNLTRFARIYVGAGYRFATGGSVSYPNASGGTSSLGTADLSGLSVQAGVKVGLFEMPLKKKVKAEKGS